MSFTVNVDELKKKAAALGQTGLNMAQSGVDKSIQLAAIAKLRASNLKEESNLRAAYVELGKMYFADHGTDPDEAYVSVCSLIGDIQAAIAANNAKIAELKVSPEVAVEVDVKAEEAPAEEPAPGEAAPEETPAEEASPASESSDKDDDGDYGFTG